MLKEYPKDMNIVCNWLGADMHQLSRLGESGVVLGSRLRPREETFIALEPSARIPDAEGGPVGTHIIEQNLGVIAHRCRVLTDAISPDLWQMTA